MSHSGSQGSTRQSFEVLSSSRKGLGKKNSGSSWDGDGAAGKQGHSDRKDRETLLRNPKQLADPGVF